MKKYIKKITGYILLVIIFIIPFIIVWHCVNLKIAFLAYLLSFLILGLSFLGLWLVSE